jgi:hypothetical protein
MNARDMTTKDVPSVTPACEFRCIADATSGSEAGDGAFVVDRPDLDASAIRAAAGIVLPTQGAGRAAALLAAGAKCVLLGESALRDASIVAALGAEFGEGRVGVFAPSRRLAVQWGFDTVSNADFKVLTPSLGAPAWEVVLADGTGTGTHTLWWIGQMLALGAAQALLRVDILDDADLNLCADCVERFGDSVWVGPLADGAPKIDEWIAFGHARRLALPPALLAGYAPAVLPPEGRVEGAAA